MAKHFITLLLLTTCILCKAQIKHVEPPYWWAGMDEPELQIMLHQPNIGTAKVTLKNAESIKIMGYYSADNPNYGFLSLNISEAPPQDFIIHCELNGKTTKISYSLKKRKENSHNIKGFDPSDIIYLITPDRFANGNTKNDNVKGYLDSVDRSQDYGRHGGDIAGIKAQLHYIKNLGFTAIWLSPVLENNMPKYSYHGYAVTDFYKVDPRFGSNEEYQELVAEANKLGIKVIMDQIVNHIGSSHWWMDDMPAKDWLNSPKGNKYTNHQHSVSTDPYASKADKKAMKDGWFVEHMPDLNQTNGYVAKYLVQNSIWWTEYSGIAGIRMDTYPYADQEFLDWWSCNVMNEYPNYTIVGEEWTTNPITTSYWQKGSKLGNYHSCLPSVMDFPLQSVLSSSLNRSDKHSLDPIHQMLGNDILYGNSMNLVIFGDNHDMDRLYTQVNKDLATYKMALAILYTMRGIPQIYYGSEVLLANEKRGDHGEIRAEMPGGWADHDTSAFAGQNLSIEQTELMHYISELAKFRSENKAITKGDFLHFVPENNIYVYVRRYKKKAVMVVVNNNEEDTYLNFKRFQEVSTQFGYLKSQAMTQYLPFPKALTIAGKSVQLFELY